MATIGEGLMSFGESVAGGMEKSRKRKKNEKLIETIKTSLSKAVNPEYQDKMTAIFDSLDPDEDIAPQVAAKTTLIKTLEDIAHQSKLEKYLEEDEEGTPTAGKEKTEVTLGPSGASIKILSRGEIEKRQLELNKLRMEATPEGHKQKLINIAQEEEAKGIPTAEAGRITLAEESLKNIDDIKKILFPAPEGTPDEGLAPYFNRSTAFASNLPMSTTPIVGAVVPQRGFMQPEQDVYRKMSASLSARQLIQTGVAARPEETAKLVTQFAPNLFSSSESALKGLNELKSFYTNYINNVRTRGNAVERVEGQVGEGEFGTRADGTLKGPGFLGTLVRPDGKVSTELSIGVNIDGKEREIPALVPTLTTTEVNYLLNGGKPTAMIVKKASLYAKQRMAANKSPFAAEGEQQTLKDRRRAYYNLLQEDNPSLSKETLLAITKRDIK